MQTQIDKAFKDLNEKIEANQLAWFTKRCEEVLAYYKSDERKEMLDGLRRTPRREAEAVRDADSEKLERLAGGKKWLALVWHARTDEQRAEIVAKNVAGLIARRDAQIIKALTKINVTTLPEFELVEFSDGFEGTFYVDEHNVNIRTILAGGYNIQCLHMRTLVKVLKS